LPPPPTQDRPYSYHKPAFPDDGRVRPAAVMLGQLFRTDNGPSSRAPASTGHQHILCTSHPVSRSRCHPNGPVRFVWRRYRLRPVPHGSRHSWLASQCLNTRLRRSRACGRTRPDTRAVPDRSLGWSVRGFDRKTVSNTHNGPRPCRHPAHRTNWFNHLSGATSSFSRSAARIHDEPTFDTRCCRRPRFGTDSGRHPRGPSARTSRTHRQTAS